jgi:hypothetical protein
MKLISMARTLLSCLHSSGKPPNNIIYSTKGQFHHKYEFMVYLFGTARTDQAMWIFDHDNGHEIVHTLLKLSDHMLLLES